MMSCVFASHTYRLGASTELLAFSTPAATQGDPAVGGSAAPKRSGAPIQFECGKSRYEELLGKSYKDLAATFEDVGGGTGSYELPKYTWESFVVCGKIIWFSMRNGPEDQNGITAAPAVDILVAPTTNNSKEGIYPQCHRSGGLMEPFIIALVYADYRAKEWPAKRAWEINQSTGTGKIVEINTQGLTCLNISYGHENE